MVDLKKMSREELESLRAQIDKRLVEVEREQRAAALNAVRDLAREHGLSVEEMLRMAAGTATASGTPPKYRDPANPQNTWTGRGRKPKWLIKALENGADMDSFAI